MAEVRLASSVRIPELDATTSSSENSCRGLTATREQCPESKSTFAIECSTKEARDFLSKFDALCGMRRPELAADLMQFTITLN